MTFSRKYTTNSGPSITKLQSSQVVCIAHAGDHNGHCRTPLSTILRKIQPLQMICSNTPLPDFPENSLVCSYSTDLRDIFSVCMYVWVAALQQVKHHPSETLYSYYTKVPSMESPQSQHNVCTLSKDI